MHYIVEQGHIFCGATAFYPLLPWQWHPGEIIQFTALERGFSPLIRYASIMSPAGSGWGAEIDVWNIVRGDGGSRVRARIMHRIAGDSFSRATMFRLAGDLFDQVMRLEPENHGPSGIEPLVRDALAAGLRPVVAQNKPGKWKEAVEDRNGRLSWRRFYGHF